MRPSASSSVESLLPPGVQSTLQRLVAAIDGFSGRIDGLSARIDRVVARLPPLPPGGAGAEARPRRSGGGAAAARVCGHSAGRRHLKASIAIRFNSLGHTVHMRLKPALRCWHQRCHRSHRPRRRCARCAARWPRRPTLRCWHHRRRRSHRSRKERRRQYPPTGPQQHPRSHRRGQNVPLGLQQSRASVAHRYHTGTTPTVKLPLSEHFRSCGRALGTGAILGLN